MSAEFRILALLVVGIVCLVCLLLSKKVTGYYLSPLGVYSLVWSIPLGMFFLPVLEYDALQTSTLLIIASSFVSFSLGFLTMASSQRLGARAGAPGARGALTKWFDHPELEKLLQVLVASLSVLGLVFSIVYCVGNLRSFGSLFFSDPQLARRLITTDTAASESGVSNWHSFAATFNYCAAILSGIWLANGSKRLRLAYLALISTGILDFAFLGRAFTTQVLILYVVSFSLAGGFRARGPDPNRHQGTLPALVVPVVATLLLIGAMTLFLEKYSTESIYTSSTLPSPVIHFYRYATNSIPALNIALSRGDPVYSWGAKTLYPVSEMLYRVGLIKTLPDAYYVADVVFSPFPSNTFTYLRPLYEDFGPIGTMVLPFILGITSAWLFIRTQEGPSLTNIFGLTQIYLLIIFGYSTLTIADIWTFRSILIGGPLILIIERMSIRRKAQSPERSKLQHFGRTSQSDYVTCPQPAQHLPGRL